MRHDELRLVGYFTGSGVDEAACRTVIGQRLMRSGILWGVRGANAITRLALHLITAACLDHCSEAHIVQRLTLFRGSMRRLETMSWAAPMALGFMGR